MVRYRTLTEEEITRDLFRSFIRHQVVTKCWRRDGAEWVIKDDSFIDDWSEVEYKELVACLQNTLRTGGLVYGAFEHDLLKGFVSVEREVFGGENRYLDLSSIHVSEDMRNQGIGTQLFLEAKRWAKEHGGKKLYISAHSAVESQAFYKKMGCIEAALYHQGHVEREPWDCQLECVL